MIRVLLFFLTLWSFSMGKVRDVTLFTNQNLTALQKIGLERPFIDEQFVEIYKNFKKSRKKKEILYQLEKEQGLVSLIFGEINKQKLPKTLFYIAITESLLNPFDSSSKYAKGIWQFIPSTARTYGLKINRYVDERKDPIKSTKTAINYLNNLYKLFGKWYLVIMAYNAGEGRIIEGVVRAKVDKLAEKWGKHSPTVRRYRRIIARYQRGHRGGFEALFKLYKELEGVEISSTELLRYQPGIKRQYIPRETRNYLRRVVALRLLFNDPNFLGYKYAYLLNPGSVPTFMKVKVPAKTPLKRIASAIQMSVKKLKRLNPQLRRNYTPPYASYIYLPYKKVALFKINFERKGEFGTIGLGDYSYLTSPTDLNSPSLHSVPSTPSPKNISKARLSQFDRQLDWENRGIDPKPAPEKSISQNSNPTAKITLAQLDKKLARKKTFYSSDGRGMGRATIPAKIFTPDEIAEAEEISNGMAGNSNGFIGKRDGKVVGNSDKRELKRWMVKTGEIERERVKNLSKTPSKIVRRHNSQKLAQKVRKRGLKILQRKVGKKRKYRLAKLGRKIRIYRVKKGENYYTIAHKFGIKLNKLLAFNRKKRILHPGDRVKIPVKVAYLKYKIRRGETLSHIAKKFKVPVVTIKKFNNLKSSFVREGQTLLIPKA